MTIAWGSEAARLLGALLACAAYASLCLLIWRRALARRQAARRAAAGLLAAADGSKPWLVAYASQTGTAERLALQTAQSLHAAGLPVKLCSLSDVNWDELMRTERALLLVSTYGEGDPPDGASAFARLMSEPGPPSRSLEHLRFAVLALGDSTYRQFCGFGRAVDQWLSSRGAIPLFERVDVDNHAVEDLARWHSALEQHGIASDEAGFDDAPFEPWILLSRLALNPGGLGSPVFELTLRPIRSPMSETSWQAGDIAQIKAPRAPERPRDYSIASVPSEGTLKLLVRQERRSDGQLGLASGWLTDTLEEGAELPLRIRPNSNFRATGNAGRRMILIGNGTGLAGLRAHIAAREHLRVTQFAAAVPAVWLVFGEREERHDFHWREDLARWQRMGLIARLDTAFSRDTNPKTYVQGRLREHGDEVVAWVDSGAAIYVCGSLQGMAAGVHAVLASLLGEDRLRQLASEGRYRRDVY